MEQENITIEKNKKVSFKKVFTITLYVYITLLIISIIIGAIAGGVIYMAIRNTSQSTKAAIEDKIKMETRASAKMDSLFNAASQSIK